ncbi:MAG TPA: hypothetical protein VEX60_05560 [Pyrinomonadaceae bacterium]|nr:hypothetical protein [Pyrinomonadaceae bacterium]
MDTNQTEETPDNITTDAESQEFGAQHGQTIEGENTGTSAPDASNAQQGDDTESGEGTGARAGAYS